MGSVSYMYLPNVDMFHYIILKIAFVNITIDLIRKLFKYEKAAKLTVVDSRVVNF